jgi:hypothetical protein
LTNIRTSDLSTQRPTIYPLGCLDTQARPIRLWLILKRFQSRHWQVGTKSSTSVRH